MAAVSEDLEPRPTAARDALRAVLARIDTEALLARMEEGFRELPAYTRFVAGGAVLDDRGRAAIRWNLELFLHWLADGRPPDDATLRQLRELVRVRAGEGLPIEDGLLVYRHGARLGWEALLELADGDRAVLLDGADVFLDYVATISDVFGQAYAAEHDSPIGTEERRARTLLDRLCAHAPLGSEEHELADRVGFRIGDALRPFALMLVGGSARAHGDAAARLRRAGVLAATEGPRVTGVAHAPVAWEALGLGARLLVAEGPPAGRETLADALEDLRALVAIARRAGRRGRVDAEEFLPDLLLHASPLIAARLEERVFGPLRRGARAELVTTLELLAAHDFDRAATAAALPIHRNTLRYRLDRVRELTGLDVDRAHDRGLIWLATMQRRAVALSAPAPAAALRRP
jgi:hypothetical protein